MAVDTIVNWLWEGIVVAAALAWLLRPLARARASVRYVVCWAALLCVLALPMVPALVSLESPLAGVPMPAVAAGAPAPGQWMPAVAVLFHSTWLVAGAWAVWAAAGAARLGWAAHALRRARLDCRPMPAAIEASLGHWCAVRGTGRPARLVVSDRVNAAAVLGWGRPMIAVSPALVRQLDADELDRVVIHEWAHVQRRDDLTYGAQRIAGVVAGWHPAVWWIDRRLHVEREVACDERAVSVTGSAKSYAACLLKVASLPLGSAVALPAPGMAAGAGLRTRIARIVSHGGFVRTGWSIGVAAVTVSLMAALSVGVGSVQWVEGLTPAAGDRGSGIGDQGSGTGDRGTTYPESRTPNQERRTPNEEPRTTAAESRTTNPNPGTGNLEPGTGNGRAAALLPAPEASTAPQPLLEATPISIPDPPSIPPALAGDRQPSRRAWEAVAAGGVAVGRTSADVGEATAGFFTRAAQRIAGAF